MTAPAVLSGTSDPNSVNLAHALDGALDTILDLPATAATELLLIRHGEAACLMTTEEAGDPPLSMQGREHALHLAARLSGRPLEAVYASPARVAIETATIVSSPQDLPVHQIAALRDLDLNTSSLNGLAEGAQKLEAELCVRFINNPRWDSLRGVEPSRSFRHRTIQAIEAIAAENEGRTVAVITHQANINAYLSMIPGIERDMFFRAEFTSVSTVRILRDLYGVRVINDCSHLPAASAS